MKYFTYTTFVLFTLLIFQGCIKSELNVEKRVQVYFFADGIGENLVYGTDTLEVSEIKFTLTGFSVTTEDGVEIGTSSDVDAVLYIYNEFAASDVLIISTGLGFEVNNFVGHKINVDVVSPTSLPSDEDFFEGDNAFSFVIKGNLNGEEFIFKSSTSFEKFSESEVVTLDNSNEVLIIRSILELDELFLDSEGNFLNPVNSSNESKISLNLENNLETTLSSGSLLF
jgi:hypothetical protein